MIKRIVYEDCDNRYFRQWASWCYHSYRSKACHTCSLRFRCFTTAAAEDIYLTDEEHEVWREKCGMCLIFCKVDL